MNCGSCNGASSSNGNYGAYGNQQQRVLTPEEIARFRAFSAAQEGQGTPYNLNQTLYS